MPRITPYCLPTFAMLLFATAAASAQTLTVDELLQSPRQFVDRRVTVSGYYYCDFEAQVLFADRGAATHHNYKRAVWVDSEPPVESELRPGQIIGVFLHQTGMRYGLFGLCSGAVVNATIHLRRNTKPAPNHAMERTAGSRGFLLFMKFYPQPAATRSPTSRRSSYSR